MANLDKTITISKEDFISKAMKVAADMNKKHPELGFAFMMTSVLIVGEVANGLFGEDEEGEGHG